MPTAYSSRRIPMNTAALQAAWPDVYRQLYSHCQTVVSAPRFFSLTCGETARFGSFSVKQHIPLRTYVGLEPRNDTRIVFQSVKVFQPRQQRFIERTILERIRKVIEDQLITFLARNRIKLTHGYNLHVVFELPDDRSCGTSGSFLNSLVAAILLDLKLLETKQLDQWKNQTGRVLFGTNSSFQRFHKLVIDLHTLVYPWNSGSACTASFMSSATPIITFSGKSRPIHLKIHEMIKRISQEGEQLFSPWPVVGYRLNEFISNPIPSLPFDVALIYNGYASETFDKMLRLDVASERLFQGADYVRRSFADKVSNRLPPLFYRVVQSHDRAALWSHYLSGWVINDVMLLFALRKCYEIGYTDSNAEELAQLFHNQYFYMRLFGWKAGRLGDILEFIRDYLKRKDGVSGLYHDSYSQYGEIVVVTKTGLFREDADGLISQLRRKHDPNISLDYASWLDGIEAEGIRVEQSIQEGRRSDQLPVNTLEVTVWGEAWPPQQRFIAPEERQRFIKSTPIVLDLDERAIYLAGQPLTSKDLHSSKVAIIVLEKLIERHGQPVASSELSIGSYRDRNEMQSKIVGPLKRAVAARLKLSLPLTISGGLGREFTLTLKPNRLKIAKISPVR